MSLLLAKTKESEWIPHQNSKNNKLGENQGELDNSKREDTKKILTPKST
jgi:hypothetical protein